MNSKLLSLQTVTVAIVIHYWWADYNEHQNTKTDAFYKNFLIIRNISFIISCHEQTSNKPTWGFKVIYYIVDIDIK